MAIKKKATKTAIKEKILTRGKDECCTTKSGSGCTGSTYALGVIGAAVYFIQQAPSFWAGVLGVLKALVWPAFVVYKLLEFLK